MIVDAGSGCIASFEKFHMPSEKIIKEYFKQGADIVMFSGDKLLGGPQCGIIAGKKKYINMIANKINQNSVMYFNHKDSPYYYY